MSWASVERVRAISGITVEQLPNEKLQSIIQEVEIMVRRMALYEFKHYAPLGTKWEGDKIQFPEDFLIADGNFDKKIDKADIQVYGCVIGNGFLRKEILAVKEVKPRDNLIVMEQVIPEKYQSLWVECWLNPAGFSMEELAYISTMYVVAICYRRVFGKEKEEIANEFEEKARKILVRSYSTFIE